MFFLQAWAATCRHRHALLLMLMEHAVESGAASGITPDRVSFYEHVDFDKIYGTGCNPCDHGVMFDDKIDTMGANIMGRALTQTAYQVYQLQTYDAYADWFIRTFENPKNRLFVLKT